MKTRINKKLLFILLLFLSISYTNAEEINCASIKDKEPEIFQNPTQQTLEHYNKILKKCAKLDSLDIIIINPNHLLGFLLQNKRIGN